MRRAAPCAEEKSDQKLVHRLGIQADAPVAILCRQLGVRELEAVDRGRGSQALALMATTAAPRRVLLADHRSQQRIEPQSPVIVHFLVAEREGQDPLRDDLLDGVLDPVRVAVVDEAVCQAPQDSSALLDRAEQQRAGIRGEAPPSIDSTASGWARSMFRRKR